MSFSDVLLMMFSAILVENFIFSRFYGCCPFLGVSEKPDTALGMGMAVTFVMTVSGAATWAVYHYLLVPFGLEYLRTVAFILVIAALVQFIEMFLRRFIPALYGALGIYLPLITTNCAVLGAATIAAQGNYTELESTVFGLFSGVGFALALLLFSSLRERLDLAAVPRPLQGTPIALVTAGILAMAFVGFAGLC
mgnify:CR=1 FL=1